VQTKNVLFLYQNCLFIYDLIWFLIILVVQTKDGTVAVASAFAGHKKGNVSGHRLASIDYLGLM
jgi:hypothetical protein